MPLYSFNLARARPCTSLQFGHGGEAVENGGIRPKLSSDLRPNGFCFTWATRR